MLGVGTTANSWLAKNISAWFFQASLWLRLKKRQIKATVILPGGFV
jgi:hypothetical protein